MAEAQSPAFSIQRLYVKDVSFEAPHVPQIFLEEWQPEVSVQMDNTVNAIDEAGVYDVQLKVNVTAQLGDKTAYIAEAVQGGVFLIAGFPEQDRTRLTASVCPDILYSYVREVISGLVIKASFPVFLLSPVNFDYLYQKRMQEKGSPEASAPAE